MADMEDLLDINFSPPHFILYFWQTKLILNIKVREK